jgi:cyclophilin family peptidyl-prolyl cis-trans isomerase
MNPNKLICRALVLLSLVVGCSSIASVAGQQRASDARAKIPAGVLLQIVRAEDERRWDNNLALLLADKDTNVRKRAALAAGRIGDERAVPVLVDLLRGNDVAEVRQMAAFALGEIESPLGAQALIVLLDDTRERGEVRARAVEALGKIAAALPEKEKDRKHDCAEAILDALKFEAGRRSMSHDLTVLLGLTAALRAKPDGLGPVIIRFLNYSDPRVVADTLNTMARLRVKDGNEKVRQLLGNGDAIVRANAARVLSTTEDKQSFDTLLQRALNDYDLRVRVSAIRALGAFKDSRAGAPLLERGEKLFAIYRAGRRKRLSRPSETNEILEIATALGRVWAGTKNERAVDWLRQLGHAAPEVEIAFARIAPEIYVEETNKCCPNPPAASLDVRYGGSAVAQGLGEIAANPNALTKAQAGLSLRRALGIRGVDDPKSPAASKIEVPDYLRAYAKFKPNDIGDLLRKRLTDSDVIIRATAAELLAELPPDETNARALIAALPRALKDRALNDAALAILDALGKQKTSVANDAIKTTLDSTDHLVRRKAVALLKENGAGDLSDRIGTVQTRNTQADYVRALGRIGKHVRARVSTSKGAFVIELLADDAPLNVDNFIQLARRGYFNNISLHRVVPNFVIQGGDPRGDGNGGPGYQIRCEINEVPYDRAAVGMALSGKDTGGSQWFVTHSPQPHLDGGYTVFGRVIAGMDVVDSIVRGDVIKSVTITEGAQRAVRARTSR